MGNRLAMLREATEAKVVKALPEKSLPRLTKPSDIKGKRILMSLYSIMKDALITTSQENLFLIGIVP